MLTILLASLSLTASEPTQAYWIDINPIKIPSEARKNEINEMWEKLNQEYDLEDDALLEYTEVELDHLNTYGVSVFGAYDPWYISRIKRELKPKEREILWSSIHMAYIKKAICLKKAGQIMLERQKIEASYLEQKIEKLITGFIKGAIAGSVSKDLKKSFLAGIVGAVTELISDVSKDREKGRLSYDEVKTFLRKAQYMQDLADAIQERLLFP